MQRLEVSGAVRPLYGSLGVKVLNGPTRYRTEWRPNASSTRYLCANLLDCSQQAAEFNSH